MAWFFCNLPFLRFSRSRLSSNSLFFSASLNSGFALSCHSLSMIQWPALVSIGPANLPLVFKRSSTDFLNYTQHIKQLLPYLYLILNCLLGPQLEGHWTSCFCWTSKDLKLREFLIDSSSLLQGLKYFDTLLRVSHLAPIHSRYIRTERSRWGRCDFPEEWPYLLSVSALKRIIPWHMPEYASWLIRVLSDSWILFCLPCHLRYAGVLELAILCASMSGILVRGGGSTSRSFSILVILEQVAHG